MALATAKLPVAFVSGLLCLCVGIGGTLVVQNYLIQDSLDKVNFTKGDPNGKEGGNPNSAGAKMGQKGGKGGKGGDGGGGGGGGGGPNPKNQLAQLVTKLDAITVKPLKFELTTEQKKKIKEILADLDAKDAIKDEEAKEKLDSLLTLLESQKEAMEAMGYRWPGQGGGGGGGGFGGGGGGGSASEPPPNPFKTEQNSAHLKSLRETLAK